MAAKRAAAAIGCEISASRDEFKRGKVCRLCDAFGVCLEQKRLQMERYASLRYLSFRQPARIHFALTFCSVPQSPSLFYISGKSMLQALLVTFFDKHSVQPDIGAMTEA